MQRVALHGIASDWTDFPSGALQCSVLGPLLLIFVNDIDRVRHSKLLKCVDNAKLLGVASCLAELNRIVDDIIFKYVNGHPNG